MVFFHESKRVADNVSPERVKVDGAFSLLDLPAEIWSRICTLAVISDEEIRPDTRSKLYFRAGVHQPSITCICRVIREETLASFYTLDTFVIKDNRPNFPPWLRQWMRAIGSVNAQRLKGLYIDSAHGEGTIRHQVNMASFELEIGQRLVILDSVFLHMVKERDRHFGMQHECWRYHIGVTLSAR